MLSRFFRERSRAQAVKELGVLDAATEPCFDQFAQDAATAFDAPMATMSLIFDDRLWFKGTSGFQIDSMPRELSFCTHALDRVELLEVCDPLIDPRFCALPTVIGVPFIRYYIGAALRVLGGTHVGTLCVIDVRSRPPASSDQRAYLSGLARQAAVALEARGGKLADLAL